jgi:hypothetical protein
MIEVMAESQGNILGVKISGKLTTQEYEEIWMPKVEAVIQAHDKIRCYCLIEDDFQGAEAGAIWDDTKFGFKHRNNFEKLALVDGKKWMEWLMKIFAPLISGEMKFFPREQAREAWDWLKS